MQLRPYQVSAIAQIEHSLTEHRRVMLYSPTGSGKTEVAIELIRRARARNERCLFVVNRIGLVDQAARRLLDADIDTGVVQGENTRASYLPVLCCSIQTLARRGVPKAQTIIIDEAHGTAGTKAYHELLKGCNGARVIGLSATPFVRGLGKHSADLGGPLWEDLIVASSIRDLIEQGYLVDCEIYAPSTPDLSGVKVVAGDYQEDQLGLAMDKIQLIGDIVSHWKRLGEDKRTVCFATNIAHSRHIVEQFVAHGVTAEHIDCFTEDADRKAILARLASGATRIVSNVAVLAEGWDCPQVEVMILARPTRSLARYIQMAGRVLRPSAGKALARILDHSDTCERLGFPTDDLPLALDEGKPRVSGAGPAPEPKLPKLCSKCQFLKPPSMHECPACGFAPQKRDTVEVADGELRRLKRARQDALSKQQVYSQLLWIAKQRNHKTGWAAHKYKTCFGVWPRNLSEEPEEASLPVRSWSNECYVAWKAGRPEPIPSFV